MGISAGMETLQLPQTICPPPKKHFTMFDFNLPTAAQPLIRCLICYGETAQVIPLLLVADFHTLDSCYLASLFL